MSATFEIIAHAIRTTTVGEMANAIKQVDWTLKGTQDGQAFELPQSTIIADPSPEVFIALGSVTPANVATWVTENTPAMEAIKAHIQIVLDRACLEASLSTASLPWVTEPAPTE